MKKLLFLLSSVILFFSCSQRKSGVPEKILQFSEETIEASINTYPPESFYQTYFDKDVPQEYIDKLVQRAFVWNGKEHTTELRKATLLHQNSENTTYLLNYWVTFKERRKFNYVIGVVEKEGKMALNRFEPIDANIADSFYSPETKFDFPKFEFNLFTIILSYFLLLITFLFIIGLVIKKRKYIPLLVIPLLFVYQQKMTLFKYDSIQVSSSLQFGFPHFKDLDLHFTSISITTIGVFCAWGIIGLYWLLLWTATRRKNNAQKVQNLNNSTYTRVEQKHNK